MNGLINSFLFMFCENSQVEYPSRDSCLDQPGEFQNAIPVQYSVVTRVHGFNLVEKKKHILHLVGLLAKIIIDF